MSATSFFGGEFFGGEFFNQGSVAEAVVRSGGGGIQPRRKRLGLPYKPSGLGGYRKKHEERLEEIQDDAAEIAAKLHEEFASTVAAKGRAQAEKALQQARDAARAAMEAEARLAKARDEEIGHLLRLKMQMDDEQTFLMILQALDEDDD